MDILTRVTQQAEQVEVMTMESETTTVNFEANKLKGSEVEETRGIALRVVKEGHLGFSATSDLDAVEKLIDNAIASSAYGEAIPIEFPEPQPGPDVTTYDADIVDLPISRLVEIGREVVDLLTAENPEVKVKVDLKRGIQRTAIRNHKGTDVEFERTPFSMLIQVDRVREDDILVLFDYASATVWEEDVLRPARQLAEKLRMAEETAMVTSGKMPVLFSPNGAIVLGLPLMIGLEGRNVYKGISPLAGKVGQALFDSAFSLIDDPTLNGRYNSATHDDEGVAHRRTPLIEDGILKSFYYDLKTAAQAGAEPTGNGSRGLFSPPRPSPTNLVFTPGETPVAEIIASIDEGLMVDSVLGLGQGNLMSGAFSNPASLAFKIEDGEIVGQVKGASIAGNVYELLRDVGAISKEANWVYNQFMLPYILLPNLNVVTKQ
jgi:PmbA protein